MLKPSVKLINKPVSAKYMDHLHAHVNRFGIADDLGRGYGRCSIVVVVAW